MWKKEMVVMHYDIHEANNTVDSYETRRELAMLLIQLRKE